MKRIKEKWFRCSKCGEVAGPYGKDKEVCFCAKCGSIMQQTSKESAKKKMLFS